MSFVRQKYKGKKIRKTPAGHSDSLERRRLVSRKTQEDLGHPENTVLFRISFINHSIQFGSNTII